MTPPTYNVASLRCDGPVFLNWSSYGTVNVIHEGIKPDGVYEIQIIDSVCDTGNEASYSTPLGVVNSTYGDVVGSFDIGAGFWEPPDGDVGILDAVAILDKFAAKPGAPSKSRADLEPACPDSVINITDVLQALSGFASEPYPFSPSAADPCDAGC